MPDLSSEKCYKGFDNYMEELNRHLRIFVSSTFLDMFEEREVLQKEVFLELKKIAKKRNVEITEVDLRWGITEDEAGKGETVKRCLDEIERCKKSPIFFLGIVGCRYGWKEWHDGISEALLKSADYGWISSLVGCSITELEIQAALRNNIENKAFLYLKKCDKKDKEVSDFHNRLEDSYNDNSYVAVTSYTSIEDFKIQTFDNFKNTLDELFPEDKKMSEIENIRSIHYVFSRTRQKLYIHDEDNYKAISNFLEGEANELLIHGNSGLGKSSLIANYFSEYRKNHDDLLIEHYIGAAGHNSGELFDIFRHIMLEIKEKYDVEDPIPNEKLKIIESMVDWLQIPTHKTIIVLDGFNQLTEEDRNSFFIYFQQEVYENIKLVITAIQESYPLELKWNLYPLRKEQQKNLINSYLLQYGKKLPNKILNQIMLHNNSSNPLFLKLLLDEIRVFGVYEKLEEMINNYLKTKNIKQLFFKIFDRLKKDYERKHPGLLEHILSLIYVSRDGLSETNLLEIINENPPENFSGEVYLQQLYLSPIILAIEEQLVDRDGLYSFFHDYIRQAVHDKYICNDSNVLVYKRQIINYFSFQEASKQKFREYPWQLNQVGDDITLSIYLLDVDCFIYLTDNAYLDLFDYYIYSNEEFYIDELVLKSKVSNDIEFIQRVASFISMYMIDDKRAIILFEKAYQLSKIIYGADNPKTAKIGLLLADELLVQMSINESIINLYKDSLNVFIKHLGNANSFTQMIRKKTTELSVRWEQQGNMAIYKFICESCGYLFESENSETYSCPICFSENINLLSVKKKQIEENFLINKLIFTKEEIETKTEANKNLKLNFNMNIKEIMFLSWIDENTNSSRLSHILEYCIQNLNYTGVIDRFLIEWLSENKYHENYFRILKSSQQVSKNIKIYINEFFKNGFSLSLNSINFLELINFRLDQGGDFSEMDKDMAEWIKVNIDETNVFEIMATYKEYGREDLYHKMISEIISPKLSYYDLIKIIKLYLANRGNFIYIDEKVSMWINTNSNNSKVYEIIKIYKKFGVNVLVDNLSLEKMIPNIKYKELKEIIESNFENEEDSSAIDAKVVKWIKAQHANNLQVSEIIELYIENGRKDSVHRILLEIISKKLKRKKLTVMIELYLENGGNFDDINEIIIDWFYKNDDDLSTKIIIGIYKKYGEQKTMQNLISNIIPIKLNTSLIELYLACGGRFTLMELKIMDRLNSINLKNNRLLDMIEIYVENGGSKSSIVNWFKNNSYHDDRIKIRELLKIWKYI